MGPNLNLCGLGCHPDRCHAEEMSPILCYESTGCSEKEHSGHTKELLEIKNEEEPKNLPKTTKRQRWKTGEERKAMGLFRRSNVEDKVASGKESREDREENCQKNSRKLAELRGMSFWAKRQSA